MDELSPEEIKTATERYPGMPVPLAISRYLLDRQWADKPMGPLCPGLGWGGVHLETVGMLVQKLANAMYQQGKKALVITIEATDFPESWDHIWLEIKDVDGGTPMEIGRMGLSGWPCCACGEVITVDDLNAVAVMLEKRAVWKHPTWGNGLRGIDGLALAVLCGRCAGEKRQPVYAVKKVEDNESGGFERVPLTELKDIIPPSKRVPSFIESIAGSIEDPWPPPEPVENITLDDVTPEDVPDINAVFRLCFHFWEMSPEDVCLKLSRNRDSVAGMSPWKAWLVIKETKQSK